MSLVETNVLKCITLSKMGYEKKSLQEFIKTNPKETALLEVLAFVTAYKVEQNKKDASKASIRFEGMFQVTDRLTGEEFNAAQAFFPGPAESYLKSTKDGVSEGGVRVAFMITVKKDPNEDSLTGYMFGMKALVNKDAAQDPFAELRGAFPERPKALAKPAAKAK